MARFSLRPLLNRLSSQHSSTTVSSEEDDGNTLCTQTPPTSHASSTRSSSRKVLHKSSAPARLRDLFRTGNNLSKRDLAGGPRTSHPILERDPDSLSSIDESRKASSQTLVAEDSSKRSSSDNSTSKRKQTPPRRAARRSAASSTPKLDINEKDIDNLNPVLLVEAPTPLASPERIPTEQSVLSPPVENISSAPSVAVPDNSDRQEPDPNKLTATLSPVSSPVPVQRRLHTVRTATIERQSIIDSSNVEAVKSLFRIPTRIEIPSDGSSSIGLGLQAESPVDYPPVASVSMAHILYRKIWVRRPGASPTLIQIKEDDLVDDVRDMILRKYANSLGKTFDAPDMTLRIVSRAEHGAPRSERLLGPEEAMCRTLDSIYPGGQTVEDALVIDVPQKRTPRPSPRNVHHQGYHAMDEFRPQESGTDYFPPMPAIIQPALPPAAGQPQHHAILAADHPRSISIINTGQLPLIPSPGGGRRHREHRPKYGRTHTSSPTIMSHANTVGAISAAGNTVTAAPHLAHRQTTRPRMDSSASEAHHPNHTNGVPAAPPLPSPAAPEAPPTGKGSTPPTPSGINGSPHMFRPGRSRKPRKSTPDKFGSKNRSPQPSVDAFGNQTLPSISTILDGSVPPINVLIVEDNSINLRILEGLMKRLKVRWQTAMNGQIAVEKWRAGGFHLVLMDIQMPIMNGLAATKEIRRLERVNGIGVFSSTPGTPLENGPIAEESANGEAPIVQTPSKPHNEEDDKLSVGEGLFKSPIIIVALTASSLQSDRHEALAAGCNDFLTKPVSFVWLERKVKEWGCMQALIDFDGWRKWKDYAAKEDAAKTEEQKQKERLAEEKARIRSEKLAILQEKQRKKKEEEAKEKERKAQRASLESSAWGGGSGSGSNGNGDGEGTTSTTTTGDS